MTTEQRLAKRHVMRAIASLLDHALANGDGWLYDPGDGANELTIRRRVKATRALILALRRDASRILDNPGGHRVDK